MRKNVQAHFCLVTLCVLGSFGAYMLMLGHAGVQAPRRDARYRMFHVKQCFQHLYCHLYPVSFGVEDYTFIIPVAGGSGLPHHLDPVLGHLLGQPVHLFF